MASPADPLAHRSDLGEALDIAHRAALAVPRGAGRPRASTRRPLTMRRRSSAGPLPETGIGAPAAIGRLATDGLAAANRTNGPRMFHFVTGGVTPAALAADWLTSAIDQNAFSWVNSPLAARLEQVHRLAQGAVRPAGLLGRRADHRSDDGQLQRLRGGTPLVRPAQRRGCRGAGPRRAAAAHHRAHRRLFPHQRDQGGRHAGPRPAASGDSRGLVRAPGHGGPGDRPGGPEGRARRSSPRPLGMWTPAASIPSPRWPTSPNGMAPGCTSTAPSACSPGASPASAHLVDGIDGAHSVIADGHKWLNVPYDCGFAFVRDPPLLGGPSPRAPRTCPTSTIRTQLRLPGSRDVAPGARSGRVGDPRRLRPAGLPRDGRASHGTGGRLAAQVDAAPDLERLAEAPLDIVCFRYRPDGVDPAALDGLNRALGARVLEDGRVYVGQTSTGAWSASGRPS